jgi:hypothetical protein
VQDQWWERKGVNKVIPVGVQGEGVLFLFLIQEHVPVPLLCYDLLEVSNRSEQQVSRSTDQKSPPKTSLQGTLRVDRGSTRGVIPPSSPFGGLGGNLTAQVRKIRVPPFYP